MIIKSYLIVEEFQVSGALILDCGAGLLRLCRSRVVSGPVGLLIGPFIILTVVVGRVEVEVIP